MEIPEGYESGGKVLRLKKALSWLKQAARAWNLKLVSVLLEHGFEASEANASMFVLKRGSRHIPADLRGRLAHRGLQARRRGDHRVFWRLRGA
jgi:hypothetical protein